MNYNKMSDDELMAFIDSTKKTQPINNTTNQNNNMQQSDYSKMSDDELMKYIDTGKPKIPNFQDIEPHPYINMAKDVAKKALNKSTEMLNGMRDNFNNPQQVQPQIQQPVQQQPIVKPVLNTQNASNNNQVHITNPLDNYNLKDVTNRGIDMLMRPETYTRDANAYQMETNNLNALGNNNSGVPTFKLSATQNVLTNPAIQQLKGAEKQEFAKRAIKAIVNEKLTPQQEIENNYNSRANYELANKINADMLDSLERSKANYYADNGLEQLGQGNISDLSINPISQGEYIADKLRTNIEPLQNNVIKPIGNVINDIGAGVTQGIALAPYQLYQMVTEPFRTIKSDIATRNNKEKPLSYGEFKRLSISEQKDYVNKLRKDSDVIAGVQTAFAKGGVNLVNSVIDFISNTPYMLSASAKGKDYKKVIEVKKLEKELAHKLGVNASTNEVGKALVNHLRDVKDKANDYKTVTALSEFVVSMLPFVPKSKTFISKIPDKSKLSGYISTTAKTVKPNELANAIKTGAGIGAVLSGGDTDLQGTIANATAGGLGGATLHEGGKVVKEGTKLVGKISDNVKANIEKAKYITELKKNPDNWVYETETKPTGKMRGLGLSQTPEMKTETKRVFSPFVDVDNMKSGAYKERISKTDYKELGNKKNEVEIWKPNHELGESGELKQGSLYGNVSANGVVNQSGSARPLLVDKQNPNYEEDIERFVQNATSDKSSNENITIGGVSEDIINLAKSKGVNLNGYIHTIDSKAIRHANNRHSKKTETRNDQIPLSSDDYKYIPNVIYSPDKVEYFKRKGLDHINYEKRMKNGQIFYIEEVRTGNKTLTTKTMYKKVGASDVDTITPEVTSKTSTDTNIITDNSETFKGGVEESNITPLENSEKINNNDSNNEQSREISRNEYTQETSTNKRTDVTEELETKSNKYEDYGEKISGAKKDLWSSYKDKLSEKISNSADEITLSKAFPEPNYESLLKSGIDKNLLATIKAIRDSIPDKPRSKYQVSRKEDWVNAVKVSRAFVNKLISGEVSLNEFDNGIKTSSLKDKIDLYRKIGYPSFNNVKDYSIEFSNGYYIKDGKRLDKPTSLYGLYKKTGKRTRHLINTFDTKEQAIERLKQELSNIDNTPKKKDVPLSVWKWQGEKSINGWCIGKKIGTGKYVDLKTGFKTHTEAREYLNAHKDELVEQLNKLKEEPQTRGLTNRDRIGKEYREGNVTPEQLANTFGFRGVQFGNYVEGNKRISDVNRCFDAFADLANVLNIPDKAVSLNGELGIAFGARGNGGKNSAAAHYEPNQVVINLTKKNGAGCLAHEWWHALDNYFGKMNDSEFVTETYAKRTENIRQEMVDAFKNISKVVRESLYERSKNVDKYRSKDYWSTTREMTARAFEKYLIAKAKEQGITNDYLANILGDSVVNNETSTYPLKAEMDGIIKAYDNFFDKVKTKETDKGVALYSRTNEPQSKSFKITSNDVANIISSGKTIGEMVETNPVLNVLKDEIAGLEDYTIAPMTDKEKGNGLRGIHYRDTKLITLNMEAINDKYEAVEVLAHELQHAKQGQEYHKIVNEYGLNKEDIKNLDRIANAELYKKDSVPAQVVAKHLKNKIRRKGLNSSELEKLINYHKCGIVNTKMNDCYNVNPELIEKLLNETGKLSNKKEIKRYIIDNYGRKSYNTFADYVRAYNNYLDDINETDANVFGSKIRKKQERIENERLFSKTMGFNEKIHTVGNVRTGYRDGFEKSQGNIEKLDERREGKTEFNTNRTISDTQRGIADDTSIDDVYNTDKVLKKVKKEPDSIVKDLIIPISSRLDEIAPALKHKLRRFEMESSLSENNLMKEVKPFIDKIGKMKSIDWAKYDLALKNGNIDLIQRFNEQYNLNDEYKAMQNILKKLRQNAINVGINIGEIENYYPRKVINPTELLKEYSQNSLIRKYLREIDPNGTLSAEQKIDKINTALRNHNNAINTSSSFTKNRKVNIIDKNLNRYYKDSKNALIDYVKGLNESIQIKKFFGGQDSDIKDVRLKISNKKKSLIKLKDKNEEDVKKDLITQTNASIRSIESQLDYYEKKADIEFEDIDAKEKLQEILNSLKHKKNKLFKQSSSDIKEELIKTKQKEIKLLEKELNNDENVKLTNEEIQNSVGAYTQKLINQGVITMKDEKLLKKILVARFNQKGMHGILEDIKNLSYVAVLGHFENALTQIDDLGLAYYKNGIIKSTVALTNALFKKSNVDMKDIGVDKIAQEFSSESKTSNLVNKVFKGVLLSYIDNLAKDTFINSTLTTLQHKARMALCCPKEKTSIEFYNYIHDIFGNEAGFVLENLKNKRIDDNIKYLLYSELSDVQPISLSEMPVNYLTAGNGRIFYMLKTFTIKRFDMFRNECIRKFKKGSRIEAVRNAIKMFTILTTFTVLMNMAKDSIKLKEKNYKEYIMDGILSMLGASKFLLDSMTKGNPVRTYLASYLPVTNIFDDTYNDIKGLKNGTTDIKDLRSIRNIPVVGKAYYTYMGGGVKARENEFKKNRKDEYINAYKFNNVQKENQVLKKLHDKGWSDEDIDKFTKDTLKSYKSSNTKKYKQQYIDAIKSQDMNKIEKIGRNDLPASEKRRIYEKAYNEVLEETLKGKE